MAINPAAVVKSRHTSSSRKISSTFKRPRSHQFKRIKASWRRPVGIDSKDRRGFKGTAPKPKCGYRSSKATRGANSHGFHEILVSKVD
ncbi:MAG: 60S ribosomal protein L32, partial [Paramarteilia canceri]